MTVPGDASFLSVIRSLLRYRMVAAVLAPVAALVLFSGYVIEEKLSSYRQSNTMLVGAKVARAAHGLARDLELERGATAIHLGTGRAEWLVEMEARRSITDLSVDAFRTLVSSPVVRPALESGIPDFGIERLAEARAAIDAGDDLASALSRYDRINDTLISSSARLGSRDYYHLIAAYLDLGHVKDRLGRQHAIGSSLLVQSEPDPVLKAMFLEARAERRAFMESFHGHASPAQAAFIDDVLRGPVFAEVEKLHDRALAGMLGPNDLGDWERIHLQLAGLVDDAEAELAAEMESHIHAALDSAQTAFYLVVAVVVVLVVFSLETLRRSERRASLAQEEARKLFRAVDQSPVSVMITDTAGMVEYVNPAFSRMTGYRREEIVGRNPRVLRSHGTPNDVYGNLWRTIISGREWRGEIVNRRKNGTEYWEQMTIAPVKSADGDVINYIALKEDITEVRTLRLALEREHSNSRRILETTHDAIALLDAEGRFEYTNPAFIAEFGAVSGRSCNDYFEEDPSACPSCNMSAGNESVCREWRSGRTGKTYEMTATPVTNFDGTSSILQVFHNITARKQAEEATIQAREAADLANRAKSEFLATMSHELRTPLNAIIGFSEIIENELLGPVGQAQYLEYAHDINGSGRHLLQLITDILDVSRIDANRIALREEALDPTSLVKAALNMVRDRATAGKLTLTEDIPADLPVLWGDERRVKQVLVNMLSNAVKFTPDGGRVETAARADEETGELVFSITDTGIGIAADEFDKVMAPFGQVDSGMARRYEGSGLGLPLSRKLMEMHGGRLDLASSPGKGTTVTLRFPKERVRAYIPT